MKKITLKILTLALVLVMVIMALAGCSTDPKKQLRSALTKTVNKIENSDFVALMEKMRNGGSVELTADIDDLINTVGMLTGGDTAISSDMKLSYKMYSNLKNASSLATAGIYIGGAPALDVTAGVRDNKFTLASPALLGNTAYGVELGSFTENFKNSDLYELLTEGSITDVINAEALEQLFASAEYQEFEASFDKYYNAIIDTLIANEKLSLTEEDITVGAESISAKKFVLTFDFDSTVAVIKAVVAEAKTDEQIKSAVASIAMSEGMTEEQAWAEVDAAIAELEATPADKRGGEFFVKFYVNKKYGTVCRIELDTDFEEADDNGKLSISLGGNPEKLSYVSFDVIAGGETVSAVYEVKEDSKEKYDAEIAIKQNGTALTSLTLAHNKVDGKYSLSLAIPGVMPTSISLEGTYKLSKSELVFSFENISIASIAIKFPITLKVLAEDKMPDAPENFVEVTSMTKDQLIALGTELETNLGEIIEALPDELLALFGDVNQPVLAE